MPIKEVQRAKKRGVFSWSIFFEELISDQRKLISHKKTNTIAADETAFSEMQI